MYPSYRVHYLPDGTTYRWAVSQWDTVDDKPRGQPLGKFKDRDVADWFANFYENKDRL